MMKPLVIAFVAAVVVWGAMTAFTKALPPLYQCGSLCCSAYCKCSQDFACGERACIFCGD